MQFRKHNEEQEHEQNANNFFAIHILALWESSTLCNSRFRFNENWSLHERLQLHNMAWIFIRNFTILQFYNGKNTRKWKMSWNMNKQATFSTISDVLIFIFTIWCTYRIFCMYRIVNEWKKLFVRDIERWCRSEIRIFFKHPCR